MDVAKWAEVWPGESGGMNISLRSTLGNWDCHITSLRFSAKSLGNRPQKIKSFLDRTNAEEIAGVSESGTCDCKTQNRVVCGLPDSYDLDPVLRLRDKASTTRRRREQVLERILGGEH